jgi:hypothetical protein
MKGTFSIEESIILQQALPDSVVPQNKSLSGLTMHPPETCQMTKQYGSRCKAATSARYVCNPMISLCVGAGVETKSRRQEESRSISWCGTELLHVHYRVTMDFIKLAALVSHSPSLGGCCCECCSVVLYAKDTLLTERLIVSCEHILAFTRLMPGWHGISVTQPIQSKQNGARISGSLLFVE